MTTADTRPGLVPVVTCDGYAPTVLLDYDDVDITSPARTWTATIRADARAPEGVAAFTSSAVATTGRLFTPDADALALEPGLYAWDVQYTIGAGTPVPVARGPWVVETSGSDDPTSSVTVNVTESGGVTVAITVGDRGMIAAATAALEQADADEAGARAAADASNAAAAAAAAASALLRIPHADVADGPVGRTPVPDAEAVNGWRMGYPSPKGPKAAAIGTSEEIGAGGDTAQIGTVVAGHPSNADWLLWACAGSGGKLKYHHQAGVGGDVLGGFVEVASNVAAGSPTIDITITDAPGPLKTGTSIIIDYGGAQQEGVYINAAPVDLGGGTWRVTGLAPLVLDHTAGTPGDWGMLGRFDRDVTPYAPDILFIGGPTNDRSTHTTAQMIDGVDRLVRKAHEIDAVPVVCTILPRPNLQDETDDFNQALREYADDHGISCVDMYRTIVDPATRGQIAALTFDTVHPTPDGVPYMAQAVHDDFTDHIESRRTRYRRTPVDGGAAGNGIPNPTFSTGGSGSGATFTPSLWVVDEFFSAGITAAIVPPRLTDGIVGNLLQVTASGVGHGSHGCKATIPLTASGSWPGLTPGDDYYLEAGLLRISGFKPDGNTLAIVALTFVGTLGATVTGLIYNWPRDFPGGPITCSDKTVPTNLGTLTSCVMGVRIVGANHLARGVLEVGELALHNLTQGVM